MAVSAATVVGEAGSAVAVAPEHQAVAQAPAQAPPSGAAQAQDEATARLQAQSQGRRIEVLSRRTPDSSTFVEPDGSTTTEAYAGPVRVRQSDGSWKDIDTDLTDRGSELKPQEAAADVAASDGGDRDLASVTDGSKTFGLRWSSTLPAPKIDANTATYDLGGGAALTVQALAQGFEQSVVLASAPAGPVSYRIPLTLKGLSLSKASGTGHLLLKDTAGKLVAEAPAPHMWDSSKDPVSGEPVHQQEVTTSIETGSDDSTTLVLTPDPAFFAQDLVYPVTIDPSSTLAVTTDTWVQTPDYPDSQQGSQELKSGTYDTGTDVARSYVKFNAAPFTGKHVTSATMSLYSYYSSTCATTGPGTQARRVTSPLDTSTITWGAQPSTTTTNMFTNTGHWGYDSSCPANWSNWTLTGMVQDWANGAPNDGIQIRSADETDPTTWRRFRSANYSTAGYAPKLVVNYNSYPALPSAVSVTPSAADSYDHTRYVSSLTPSLQATVTDADGGSVQGQFEITADPAYADTAYSYTGTSASVSSGSTAKYTVPSGNALPNGVHLRMRVRGYDGTDYGSWSSYTAFATNTGLPDAPAITCTAYPSGVWTAQAASSTCTLDTASTDVGTYRWGLDNPATPNSVNDTTDGTGGDPLTVTIKPAAGWHTLYAKSVDVAGNVSSTATTYSFGVGSAAVSSPHDQDTSSTAFTLQATAPSGPAKVTFQYRKGANGTFTAIPAADVKNGSAAVTWPASVSTVTGGVRSPALTWSATHTLNDDGLLQIEAVFTDAAGNNAVTSPPVNVTLDRLGTGVDFGTAQAGPVVIGLQSGNASVTASDVNIAAYGSGLSVARTFNSLKPTDNTGFGPGWTASRPVTGTGEAWAFVTDNGSYATLTGQDGSQLTFTAGSAAGGVTPYSGQGPAAASGLTLAKGSSGFTLVDGGVRIVFAAPPGQSATRYLPSAVTQPGSESATGYLYDPASGPTRGKLMLMVAPDAASTQPSTTACPFPATSSSWSAGCRGLQFDYDGTTGNIGEVEFLASDGTTLTRTPVAQYTYDASGRLSTEWDPRISPALKNSYTYDETSGDADYGRLTRITPAQSAAGSAAAWNLAYNDTQTSADYGKLASASRTHDAGNGGAAAKTVVAYSVPLTVAGGGPADMDAATVQAGWGQNDAPVSAVAVFPPDHAPSANPPTDWTYAQVHYYDTDGREVNTADYNGGWNITTTEYDAEGNTVRDLTAANRAAALATGSASAAIAAQLDTRHLYNSDGTRLLDTYGPSHQAVVAGSVQTIRTHTHDVYDESAPNNDLDANGNPYNLVTTETVGASPGTDVPGSGDDLDTHTTRYRYNAGGDNLGWSLYTPLQTVTDPGTGHLNITETSTFNEDPGRYAGEPLQITSSRPSDTGGTGAGTTRTVYYTAGSNSADTDCGNHPDWADLVCTTGPAAQPGTAGLAALPVTRTTYNTYLQPVTVSQTFTAADGSTAVRTSTTAYDTAGRRTGQAITASGTGMGADVPATKTLYAAETGAPSDTQNVGNNGAVTADLHTTYDDFGNVLSYTDASGEVTHSAYDLADRLVSQSDSQGTTTFTYGTATDHSGNLTSETDSRAGTFTATYDPDSSPTGGSYPGGTTVSRVNDPTGATTSVSYTNPNWPASLTDSITVDAVGQWSTRTEPGANRTYQYDAADRLTSVTDTIGDQCTTRGYTYDPDSNRLSRTIGAPAADGGCQTGQTPQTYTYDAADRLTGPGYAYDTRGDITTTPSADAGGSGDLLASYYANGQIASQTQNGTTTSWQLDPLENRPATSTSTAGAVVTNHYSDDSDSPSWTSDSTGARSRFVHGPDDQLAASITAAGVVLDLVNLHGDTMATVDPGTSTVTSTSVYDEFGAPETGAPGTYGWLGGAQRSAAALGGQVLMGARVFNPHTGRFDQPDPVADGSCSSYDYVCANPLNLSDIAGTSLKERVQVQCVRQSCVRLRRICNEKHRCALNFDFHFRGDWARAFINPGFKWYLFDNGYEFKSGNYNHGEFGDYGFHAYWYSNNQKAHGRGWFKCYLWTCWVDPGDQITVSAAGTAWWNGEEYRWSIGQVFSGGGTYR